MELNPQQYKELNLEGFKDYKVYTDLVYIEANSATVNHYLALEKNNHDLRKLAAITLISRDCEQSILTNPCWEPYDLHETKPFFDSTVFQIKQVVEQNNKVPVFWKDKHEKWQLSEAKLELINRN